MEWIKHSNSTNILSCGKYVRNLTEEKITQNQKSKTNANGPTESIFFKHSGLTL